MKMNVNPSTRRQIRGNETIETKDFIARPYQVYLQITYHLN